MTDFRGQHDRGTSAGPFILIGIGTIWLLTQANVLTSAHLSVLFRLWPVILIAVGVQLLVGRSSRTMSMLLGLGAVLALIALMLVGPSIGLAANVDAKTASYVEPLENVERARVDVEMATGHLKLDPITSENLLEADISYLGDVRFSSNEGAERQVRLDNSYNAGWNPFVFFNFFNASEELEWNIGLSESVPVDLNVKTGTGGANLNLTDIVLRSLTLNSGTGGMTVALPAIEGDRYEANIDTGTGGIHIDIERGAQLALEINSGTGGVTVDIPDDASVRLEGDVGTGRIDVPSNFERLDGDDDRFIGDAGVWQTEGLDGGADIVIIFNGGTGSLDIR